MARRWGHAIEQDESTKTRSEYFASLPALAPRPLAFPLRSVVDSDRGRLATLLLDAYRGTIDDDGEDESDALEAIDFYLATIDRRHSVVADDGGRLLAMSFVVAVDGRCYIDPVATVASSKRRGLGTAVVAASMQRLAEWSVPDVGAVITDGNLASERLFGSLGFRRIGAWPR